MDQTNQENEERGGWQCEKKILHHLQKRIVSTTKYWTLISLGLPQYTTLYAEQAWLTGTGTLDFFFDYLLSTKGREQVPRVCPVHGRYDKRPASNITQLKWPSQAKKKKNITWLVRFQCTHVVKQNINWRVYVTWSEPKYQPTFSCSFPGKQAFPLDRFRGRTPWIHSRFRQGSMQAKQRFRIVSAESLDCVFLTSILWGRKTMKVKGFMISKIRKG